MLGMDFIYNDEHTIRYIPYGMQIKGKCGLGNITIKQCTPTNGTVRKSHIALSVTRQDNQSTANSSCFSIKIIAKLEKTLSTQRHNKTRTKHRTPTNNCLFFPSNVIGWMCSMSMALPGSEVIKRFFWLNSTEHKIYHAHKC